MLSVVERRPVRGSSAAASLVAGKVTMWMAGKNGDGGGDDSW